MTWQIKAAAIAVILASTFWAGREWRDRSCELQLADIKIEAASAKESAEDALIAAALANQDKALAEKAARDARAQVIVKRVIEYVQDPDAGKCDLPDNWVLLHDDGWRDSAPPGSTEPSYGADREITDVEAAAVSAHNARICGDAVARLAEWQEFWRNLKEANRSQ